MAKYQGVLNSTSIDLANLDGVLTQMAGSSAVQISDGGYYTVMFNYPKNGFYNLQESNFEVSNPLICNRSSLGKKEDQNTKGNGVMLDFTPNPAKSTTTVFVDLGAERTQGQIRVLNQYGVTIRSLNVEGGFFDLDTSELSPGMYFIQLKSENIILVNKRLITVR